MKVTLATLILVVIVVPATLAQDKPTVPFYGNEKCPVMGKAVNKRWAYEVDGQRIYTCCRKCWKAVKAEPKKHLAKAYPQDKVKTIKVDKCPISGKEIKGDKAVVWQGHKVPVCCDRCAKAFLKEPNKRLALTLNKKLKEAKNKICPIMPEEKVEPDMFILYKGNLINICCDSCVTDAQDDPKKHLKKFQ
ncbi:MAG: hypothetical protein CMJ83_22570 [Planctomycetes bacterium]|nr:hypothetical protein [Planctomycetota bacterium]